MNTESRKNDRLTKIEGALLAVGYFLILIVSPVYGIWSLNYLPVV